MKPIDYINRTGRDPSILHDEELRKGQFLDVILDDLNKNIERVLKEQFLKITGREIKSTDAKDIHMISFDDPGINHNFIYQGQALLSVRLERKENSDFIVIYKP